MSPLLQIANNLQERWSSWRDQLTRQQQERRRRRSATTQSQDSRHALSSSCATIESIISDSNSESTNNIISRPCSNNRSDSYQKSNKNERVLAVDDADDSTPQEVFSSSSSSSPNSFTHSAQHRLNVTKQWLTQKIHFYNNRNSVSSASDPTTNDKNQHNNLELVIGHYRQDGKSESNENSNSQESVIASNNRNSTNHNSRNSIFAPTRNLLEKSSTTTTNSSNNSNNRRISIQSLQIQLRNISIRMFNSILHCFGRKDTRELIETISTPLPVQSPLELPMPSDTNEIHVKFASIVDELDLTQENKITMLELPLEKKWQIYCSKINEQEALFNYTPEYYIDRLSQNNNIPIGKQSTKLYDSLKTSLRTQPNSFVQRFLELNGLDYLLQNSAIGCLKALLNNSTGRAFVLAHSNALNIISQSLSLDDGRVKVDVLEILGAVCLVPGGHRKVLNAVNYFQEWYGERTRFQTLITELDHHPFKEQFNSDNITYKQQLNIKTAIISFLNAILSYGPGQTCLEFRLHLRYELLMLGIIPIIDKLRTSYSESATLVKHLNFFEEMRIDDEKEYASKFDLVHIDFTNLNEILALLCEKLTHTSEYGSLSSTLIHLLILGASDQRWNIIDKLVQQITLDAYNVQDAIVVEDLVQKLTTETLLSLESNVDTLKRENAELLDKLNLKDNEIEQLMTELIIGREKYHEVLSQLQSSASTLNGHASKATSPNGLIQNSESTASSPIFGSDQQFKNRFDSLKSSLENSSSISSSSSSLSQPTSKFVAPPLPNGCGPPPPPPPMFPMQQQNHKPKGKLPPSSTTPLKSFNWSKLPEAKIQPGTIWWNIQEQYEDLDLQEIDRLFSAKTSTMINGISDSRETQSQVQQRKMLTLIDSRRAQNCTILLSKLKMSDEELCKLIGSMDTKDQLPIDMIEQLLKFVPTSEEKALLEEHQEDELFFARADTFLLNVSRIPHYEERLRSLQFRKRFPGLSKDLQWKMNNVIKACNELQSSKQFIKILQLILSLGNYMNKGGRGNASGFKLSSLTRLADTKSTCKTTLVNYLVNQIEEKYPTVMSVENEIKSVKEAAKVSLPDLEKDMVYLRTGLQHKEESLEAKYKIESLEKLFVEMKRKFSETVTHFGEDYTQIDEFFIIFDQFLNILSEAKMENLRRLKKKRDEELQQQQQSTLRRQPKKDPNSASNSTLPTGNSNNEFDDLISALRTGDVFSDLDHTKKKRCRKSRERIH